MPLLNILNIIFQNKKVFTIIGPYHSLRLALRKRGWVEKFLNAPPPGEYIQKKKPPAVNPDDPGMYTLNG